MQILSKHHLRNGLKSGLAYGIGLGLGSIITVLIFAALSLTPLSENLPADALEIGLLLALGIAGFGAAVGGWIGGLTLPLPANSHKTKLGLAWRSGLSIGLSYGAFFYPLGLAIALFSFYTISEISTIKFDLIFALYGLLFGAFAGLLLGILTMGHRLLRVTLQVAGTSALGFGLGGFLLGNFIRRYLLTLTDGNIQSGQRFWLLVGFLLFGFFGGAALGAIYSRLAEAPEAKTPSSPSRRRRIISWGVAIVVIFGLLFVLDPVFEALVHALTPEDAGLGYVLDPTAVGTHWSDAVDLHLDVVGQSAIAADPSGRVSVGWSQAGDVFWMKEQNDTWHTAVNISNSPTPSSTPQIVMDNNGLLHLVWVENGTEIFHSQCQDDSCQAPVKISEMPTCAANAAQLSAPTLAVADSGTVMIVWQTDTRQLLYHMQDEVDCVPIVSGGQPRIAAGQDGRFILTYNDIGNNPGEIHTIEYKNDGWQVPSAALGAGSWPQLFVDSADAVHLVWCGTDNQVNYWFNEQEEIISALPCRSRPILVQDSDGVMHVIWYSDAVENVNGRIQTQSVLYESIKLDSTWNTPTIISHTGQPTQPEIAADGNGRLHLTWTNQVIDTNTLKYASFVPYSCDDYPLSNISQVAHTTARDPDYRPTDAIIPYCQNRYDRLNYMPNPTNVYSEWPSTLNGGFDDMAALAKTAEYEVLFSTMWYEEDQNQDSPGYVLVQGVAELYQMLKEHPERYPRGLTVRILLGNPPELELGNYSGQIWHVLQNLRAAGIDTMVDPEIGWHLEVANFDGALPHSHTKVVIVDGKTILAAGFNMQYEHYDKDHPSGLGKGRQDLGMQVTGPVAQASHRMYDDLWTGSNQQICSDFFPTHGIWQATCRTSTATSDHVPEVQQYYLPGDEAIAFSLYRSEDHDEADHIVANGLAAAQESVDAMQVMFSMQMVCDLNLIFKLCDFGEATEYLQGLMQAAENGANIRLIVKPMPADAIESFVAIDVFEAELVRRGLSDQVEIRLFNDPVHYKTALIDDEFLVVGSQNFHYSAYGEGQGLTEYSLGVKDSRAVEDYGRLFDYQWQRSDPLH